MRETCVPEDGIQSVDVAKRLDTAGKDVSTTLVGLQIKLLEEYMQGPALTVF